MVRMRMRRSNWGATTWSRRRIWMGRLRGRRAALARVTERSRCARCGRCRIRRCMRRQQLSRRDAMSVREGEVQEGDELARETADAVARRSYGKLVAFLAARTHDVTAAEDALSEAFLSALADWPRKGCPANPEGWLLTVARRKVIDAGRRRSTPAAGAPVCVRASVDRGGGARAADVAGGAGTGREDDCVGVPVVAGGDGQAAGAGEGQDTGGRGSRSPSRGR